MTLDVLDACYTEDFLFAARIPYRRRVVGFAVCLECVGAGIAISEGKLQALPPTGNQRVAPCLHMINPEDEVIYDTRPSCTVEEAVAKLLGWMQGSRRLRYIQVTENGTDIHQLQHLYILPSTVEEFILDERALARERLFAAVESRDFDAASEWESRIKDWDSLCERAMRYRLDISAELRKPKPSLLVDAELTGNTNVTHVMLGSLDSWACRTYGITILNNNSDQGIINARPRRTLGLQRASAILEEIRQIGLVPENLPAITKGKSGTKADVWGRLQIRKNIFPDKKYFDKAWEALCGRKEIIYAEVSPK